MVSNFNKLTFYFNKELKEKILQNFQTNDIKEIQKLIYKFLENADSSTLELKDQLLLERIQQLKEQRPLKLKKLQLQNEILQKKRDFLYNFKREISESGSQILEKSTYQKYGFTTSQNINENIQLKKNFYINKLGDSEYCGCCKVCQNFSTAICTTSKEAEGDIELHLESLHKTRLFQR